MSKPIDPNEQALLNTIRFAEGTWANGSEKGYSTMFGGGQFDWRKGHPDRVVRGGRYSSAAAGAYQFMPTTWNEVARQLGFDPKDFSPARQDQAALALARRRGVDPTKPLDAAALHKLSPEWASLPTLEGRSFHGQPVKSRDALLRFYRSQLTAQPPSAPPAPPAPSSAPSASAASRPIGTPAVRGGEPVLWAGQDYGYQSRGSFARLQRQRTLASGLLAGVETMAESGPLAPVGGSAAPSRMAASPGVLRYMNRVLGIAGLTRLLPGLR